MVVTTLVTNRECDGCVYEDKDCAEMLRRGERTDCLHPECVIFVKVDYEIDRSNWCNQCRIDVNECDRIIYGAPLPSCFHTGNIELREWVR